MDQRSMVRNHHLGGNRRPFDHHQHRRGDSHVRSSADNGSRRSRRRGSTRILTTTTNTTTTAHHHHSTSGTTGTSKKTYTKPTISHGHENSLLDSSRCLLSDTTFLDDHQYSAEMDMPVSASVPRRQRPSIRSAHALVHYLNEPQSSPPPLSRSRALVPLDEPSSVRSTPVYNEEQPRLSSSSSLSKHRALVPRHHEEQPRLSSSSSRNRALVPHHEPLPSPSRTRALARHEQSSSSLKSQVLVHRDHNDQRSLKTRSVSKFSGDSSPALLPAPHQVVVLRVSLHCKGCEAKVRKHVSRMEGVTSFNIDFANKKVTVTGDVTPLGVLTSVSKVKNAEFWPSSSTTSSPTSN
ncbi:hypothetical protein MKW98_003810 [Papaver atlanticum]|uniref:HMA domain-containing protein n=1 Tax=Papaver atlanticum TaxID=357466 RepID=A0AAD4T8E0_9MAGN|nr:hypothetical protein MKW98_003810 [Papaver atlanticum]